LYRWFMIQITPEVSDLITLNKQLQDYGVSAENARHYVAVTLAACGLID